MKLICCAAQFHKEAAAPSHFCQDPPAQTCPLRIRPTADTPCCKTSQTAHSHMRCRFLHTRRFSTFKPVPTRSRESFPSVVLLLREFFRWKIVPTLTIPGSNATCSPAAARSTLLCVVATPVDPQNHLKHLSHVRCCQTPSNLVTK